MPHAPGVIARIWAALPAPLLGARRSTPLQQIDQPFEPHLQRFRRSCELCRIPQLVPDAELTLFAEHLLKENGFPAGPHELTAEALDAIRVVPGQPKPPPPVGDFSYVEVVGCLAAGPRNAWMLNNAGEPIAAVPTASVPSTAARAGSLGARTFHLLDAMAYAPDDHKGQKMYVRGLLIRLPGEERLTISAFEMLSPTCRE